MLQFDNPIEQLVYETVALFHRMKVVAEQLHGGGEMAAGKRGILKGIELRGPQTVPQMARARPVSRQHIRAAMAPLLAQDLIELVDNPQHKRSKIVQLTPKGIKRLEQINRREKAFFDRLSAAFDARDVEAAARVIRSIREFLARESWKTAASRPARRKRLRR
jgi:DNA-binding MarR family transcriptional regulator